MKKLIFLLIMAAFLVWAIPAMSPVYPTGAPALGMPGCSVQEAAVTLGTVPEDASYGMSALALEFCALLQMESGYWLRL